MDLSNAPGKLVLPFANDVAARNVIPTTGTTPGQANLTDGFPPITRIPIASGGLPPAGLDMNGILYLLSALSRWANVGASFEYDNTFATDPNINGYPKGARILKLNGVGYWLNCTDNNTSNPDTGGAGWTTEFPDNVVAGGCDPLGTVDCSTYFNALTDGDYYLPAGEYLLSSNTTIARGVKLIFAMGAKFKANTTSITLTINGQIQAELQQIFKSFGNNKIIFDSGYSNALPRPVYPEWWGVNDGSNADQIAINNAIHAGSSVILSAQYNCNAEVHAPYGGVYGANKQIRCYYATLLAAANNMDLLHWSDSYGSVKGDLWLNGNGYTGIRLFVVSPDDYTSTVTLSNQSHNHFENIYFRNADEAVVLIPGHNVGGTDSTLYFNKFENFHFTSCKRDIWLKDNTTGSNPAIGSGSNSNMFLHMNFNGGTCNTGIQIDAGGGNKFICPHFENITSGTSPNAVPTGLIIKAAMNNTGANPNNYIEYGHWENVTRHHAIDIDSTILNFCDDDLALCNDSVTLKNRILMNPTVANSSLIGGIRSETSLETLRISYASNFKSVLINTTTPDGVSRLIVGGAARVNGNLNLADAAAGQITFPATQNASADVHTLDDYEEGDFTAAFAATGSGTITISNSYKTGHYVKIGQQVTLSGYFAVSAVSSPTGQVRITGLPFSAAAGTKYRSSVNVTVNSISGSIVGIVGQLQEGTNYIDLYDTNNGNLLAIASKFQAGTDLSICVTYFTDS